MHPQVHRPYYKLVRAGMSTMDLGYFLLMNTGMLVNSIKKFKKKQDMQNLLANTRNQTNINIILVFSKIVANVS